MFAAAFILAPPVRMLIMSAQQAQALEKGAWGDFLGGDPLMTLGAGLMFVLAAFMIMVLLRPSHSHRSAPPLSQARINTAARPSRTVAVQLMEARRFKEAADAFKHLGDMQGVIGCLIKAGEALQAAELLEAEGRRSEGAELLENSNQAPALQRAAEWWTVEGKKDRAKAAWRKAAAIIAARGEGDRAVEMLMRASDTEGAAQHVNAAAEAYARQGKHTRAGEMFEALGLDAQAAAAFDYEASTNPDEKAQKQAGWRAAKVYGKLLDWQSCARVLERIGMPEKAMEAYLRTEAWSDAARCLMVLGQSQRAAELLIAKGLGKQAVEFFESHGDMVAAGHAAVASGDFAHAAQLFEQQGQLELAGGAYLKAGNLRAAGEVAVHLGRPAEAADLLERAGHFKRAAEIQEGMGHRLRAGELYGKAGDTGGAARMLLTENRLSEAAAVLHGSNKPEVAEIQVDVARRLVMTGDLRTAVAFLRACVDARTPVDSLGMSLELSNLLEGAGDIPAALAYAQRVLQVKQDHAEAVLRVQQLFMRINNEQMRAAYEAAMQQQQAAQSALLSQKKLAEAQPSVEEAAPRYVPENELGRGAMGVVFKARDTVLNRYVALKRLPEAVASDPEARANFLNEARAAAGLNHPAIVTVFDAGVERGLPYLAMELVEGTTLSAVLQTQGPQPPSRALAYCAAIASALDHAHKAGIVHRDVKPGNILMSKDGRVKLTDFGIAAAVKNNAHDGVAGTPYYMAPEQIRNGAIDGRTDVYALGCVLHALITGSPPFSGTDVLHKHLHETPPRASLSRAGISPDLDHVLMRCLAKEPDARFESGAAAAKAFLELEARLRGSAAMGTA
jgi:tRNA A-37 threonylcarbamoyl transferase component Bud32